MQDELNAGGTRFAFQVEVALAMQGKLDKSHGPAEIPCQTSRNTLVYSFLRTPKRTQAINWTDGMNFFERVI